jgi:hypothetical protein
MENKRTQAGRLLTDNGYMQVYELETDIGSLAGRSVAAFDQTTAAFSYTHVALRTSRGGYDDEVQQAQVVLSREVFQSLLASYRAFERAEKKFIAAHAASAEADDFDPFLDSDPLP